MKMAMKAELAPVAARDLQIIEYRGQRVVTTEQLAAGYGATEQMITNNFNRNKSRFVEGKHYFKLSAVVLAGSRWPQPYHELAELDSHCSNRNGLQTLARLHKAQNRNLFHRCHKVGKEAVPLFGLR
jgi:hypothetical protein